MSVEMPEATPPVPPRRRPVRLLVYVLAVLIGVAMIAGMILYVWRRGIAPEPPPGITPGNADRHTAPVGFVARALPAGGSAWRGQ